MSKTTTKYSSEVRACAVRMVLDNAGQLGRLVQQQAAARADREHTAGGSRGALPCAIQRARQGGVTHSNEPPAKTERFNKCAWYINIMADNLKRRRLSALTVGDCGDVPVNDS